MDVQDIVKQVFAVNCKVSDVCASLSALTLTLLQTETLHERKMGIKSKLGLIIYILNLCKIIFILC